MIPRREQRGIDAVAFTTAKLPGHAPQGYVLVRVFFDGGRPRTAELGNEDLLAVVRRELEDLIGLSARPVTHRTYRRLNAFTQAEVGHLSRVEQIEASLPPGLQVAGTSYRGGSVPDCVRQGLTLLRPGRCQAEGRGRLTRREPGRQRLSPSRVPS